MESTPREQLANLVGALAVAVKDELDALAKGVIGFGGTTPAALICIGMRPGRSIEVLRSALDLSHSGAVRLVDRLEDREWVRRSREKGQRSVSVELTPTGEKLVEKFLGRRRKLLMALLDPLTDDEIHKLGKGIRGILAEMPEGREEEWQICRLCEFRVCREMVCPVDHSGSAEEKH
ncbi:MAG: MarR family transcriptional regulator [Gemmatimonadota bacterium]|nr:MarR family transcriptional regulator [Gemmatimonadota bacterium]